MRRMLAAWLCALLLLAPAQGVGGEMDTPVVGVLVYNGEDTFMTEFMAVLAQEAGDAAVLKMVDARNDQNRQNEQVEALIREGVDALIVNPVDRTAAVYQIEMAMRYDVPIVFINREPLSEDLALYERAYYVGVDPKQQGLLAGRLAAEYFLSHPEADVNGDGKMQLVLFRGEPGHQDTELRSVYAIRALQEAGVALEVLSEETAMWERILAQERMSVTLNLYAGRIECVIANNDDMALGAIDALKAAGYFSGERYLPVIGNDATAPALEALKQGSLYGTVCNDAQSQGRASLLLALLLARGGDLSTFPYAMENKVVYIDSSFYRAGDQGF